MNRKLVVKGHPQDIALLMAFYSRLNLDWQAEPWMERPACPAGSEVRPEISKRVCGPCRVIPFPLRRVS